jgi:hypothetical protein
MNNWFIIDFLFIIKFFIYLIYLKLTEKFTKNQFLSKGILYFHILKIISFYFESQNTLGALKLYIEKFIDTNSKFLLYIILIVQIFSKSDFNIFGEISKNKNSEKLFIQTIG